MLDHRLLRPLKTRLKSAYRRMRLTVVRLFFSYGPDELVRAVHALGVKPGDSVMLHAAFESHHGFGGSIEEANEAFRRAVGPDGALLMVSMPYLSSAQEFLRKLKVFDVRKTPSLMGLMSEFFRRRPDVLRSTHPTHPVLACGTRAEWFVKGHDECCYPCGPGSPFEKLLQVGGKVVFFNVPFLTFTFFHYLEHRVSPHVAFPLYVDEAFQVPVIDRRGLQLTVRTYAYSQEAIRRRRPERLESWLRRQGLIRSQRVGASTLLMVDLRQVVELVDDMTRQGVFFYETGAIST